MFKDQMFTGRPRIEKARFSTAEHNLTIGERLVHGKNIWRVHSSSLFKDRNKDKDLSHHLSLVWKQVDSGKLTRQLQTYAYLIEHPETGLNLLPFFREYQDGLLMTDLSNNGKNIVISSNDLFVPIKRQLFVEKIIKKFPDLVIKLANLDLAEFMKKLEASFLGLIKLRMNVRSDAFFVVFRPDSTFDIYVVDIDDVYRIDHDYDPQNYQEYKDTFARAFTIFVNELSLTLT